MERNTSAEVTEGDAPFALNSPWSQPPIHRPAPRADPEPSRWTRRDVRPSAIRFEPPPSALPIASPVAEAPPDPAEPAELYEPVNGGHVYPLAVFTPTRTPKSRPG